MGAGRKKEFCLLACLCNAARSREGRGKNPPRGSSVGFLPAQVPDRIIILAIGKLGEAQVPIIPVGRVRIEAYCPFGRLHTLLGLSNEGFEIGKHSEGAGVIGIQTNGSFVMSLGFVPAAFVGQDKSVRPVRS